MQEIKIGKFKTRNNFLSFISGSKFSGTKIRLNRDEAYIDGNKLSGMLSDIKFKITICDENTIDFEEVDDNKIDDDTIKRLIEDIEISPIIGYAEKFVIEGLEFRDVDNNICYLEVENSRPINKLKSLLEDSKNKKKLSNKGLNALDRFLSLNNVAETKVEEAVTTKLEVVLEKVYEKKLASDIIEESFKKMNDDKIIELRDRVEKLNIEKSKYMAEIKMAENNISRIEKDITILNSRLEDMKPSIEPNGYVFFLSEEKEKMELDEESSNMIDKICKLAGLNYDAVSSLVSDSRFDIKIAKKDNINELVSGVEVLEKLKLRVIINEDYYTYVGDLKWGEIVNKMIKLGFEQDPEFDKLCGSNSYNSKINLDGKS